MYTCMHDMRVFVSIHVYIQVCTGIHNVLVYVYTQIFICVLNHTYIHICSQVCLK